MCKQVVAIAQCAPSNPETCALAFQCGQLHHYAAARAICEEAKGDCVCFFGTCGRIDNVVHPKPFDLVALPKIRCLICTNREEQVGERRHGRDFLETKLLTREAVDDKGMPAYAKILKECWEGANECPYHDVDENDSLQAASVKDGADAKSVDDHDGANNDVVASAERGNAKSPTALKTMDGHPGPHRNGFEITSIHEADGNPAVTPIKKECPSSHGTPNKLDNISASPQADTPSPNKNGNVSPKIKSMLGIETSRWAPDAGDRLKATPEPEKGFNQEAATPRSIPRRDLHNTPNIEPGKSALADRAGDIKKFLGL